MDRTITRTGTFTPFLIYAAARLAPWRLLFAPVVPFVMLAYAAKLISRAKLKEVNQRLLLGPHLSKERLAPIVDGFAERTVRLNALPGAMERIEQDRADGYRLVLATASYRFYVEAIAGKLAFDDVIATNSIIGLDARIAARIDGENNYGPAKLRMVESWMAAEGIDRSTATIRFYSDHVSDAPVLEWADEAFATTPSPKLRALAEKRGWPILDWSRIAVGANATGA
ncbi:HAD family hydrolase [Sphingomonas sp. ID0503]|uniref:HAD family hydrolase n=1 Tax=Sphingomonas sp. ID0503 TaxID=3399691 RepID=UPI003AFAFC26